MSSVTIDHAGLPAAGPPASARFPASIVAAGEVTPGGPDGEMARPGAGDGALLFIPAGESR